MIRRDLILNVALAMMPLLCGVAAAQTPEVDPFGPAPEVPPDAPVPEFNGPQSPETVPNRAGYPSMRLVYYAGPEGNGWKEIAYFDFDGWTAEKDIIITAKWIQRSGARSYGESNTAQLRRQDPFKAHNSRVPQRRAWKVEYADAATEGESHIFVNAPGLPRISERILHERDFISFLHIPTSGWHQLGAAARAYRYAELEAPPQEIIPSPSDTRSR